MLVSSPVVFGFGINTQCTLTLHVEYAGKIKGHSACKVIKSSFTGRQSVKQLHIHQTTAEGDS